MFNAALQFLVPAALLTSVAICASASGPQVVEMNAPLPSASTAQMQQSALTIAKEHARSLGLTSCADPAQAELSDTVLALPTDAAGMPIAQADRVQVLDLDGALASADHDRRNLLACAAR